MAENRSRSLHLRKQAPKHLLERIKNRAAQRAGATKNWSVLTEGSRSVLLAPKHLERKLKRISKKNSSRDTGSPLLENPESSGSEPENSESSKTSAPLSETPESGQGS